MPRDLQLLVAWWNQQKLRESEHGGNCKANPRKSFQKLFYDATHNIDVGVDVVDIAKAFRCESYLKWKGWVDNSSEFCNWSKNKVGKRTQENSRTTSKCLPISAEILLWMDEKRKKKFQLHFFIFNKLWILRVTGSTWRCKTFKDYLISFKRNIWEKTEFHGYFLLNEISYFIILPRKLNALTHHLKNIYVETFVTFYCGI